MFLNIGGRYLFSTGETTVHVQCAVDSEADCIGAADFFKKVDQISCPFRAQVFMSIAQRAALDLNDDFSAKNLSANTSTIEFQSFTQK
jgi:hypothetical protein